MENKFCDFLDISIYNLEQFLFLCLIDSLIIDSSLFK